MGDFYTEVIMQDPRHNSAERCADVGLLEPVTRRKVQAIVSDAKSHGVELMVYETFRSQTRQAQLFADGVTQLRRVGVHGFGLAADLVRVENGEPSWEGDFSLLWHLARVHDLISGRDWGFPDRPHSFRDNDHVQRVSERDQEKLFGGAWYPDEAYSPYANL